MKIKKLIRTTVSPILNIVKLAGRAYTRAVCKAEYEKQIVKVRERFVEYEFVFRVLRDDAPERVLDVGAGTVSLPHLISTNDVIVTAVDKNPGLGAGPVFNRHFFVIQDDITNSRLGGQYDCVTCVSALEHIPTHAAAVEGMVSLLRPGGKLVMTFPYNEREYVPNAYDLPGSAFGIEVGYICQIFSREQVNAWISECPIEIETQEYWRLFSGEFLHQGERLRPPAQSAPDQPHHLTCVVFKKTGEATTGQS